MAFSAFLDTLALAGGSSAKSMYSHASIRSTILFGKEGIPLPRAISVTGLDIVDNAAANDRAAELEGVVPLVGAAVPCVIVLMLVGSRAPAS